MKNSIGVLLISETPDKTKALHDALIEFGYQLKSHISVIDDVIDEVERCKPDMVVVKTEETSRYFMNQLYNLNQFNPKPIVIFTDKSESDLIEGAVKAGVSAYVVNGLSYDRVGSILELARARFNQDQSLRQELTKTRSQLEDRKTIEKAKGLIMKSRSMSEDEAYKSLRKLAMNRNQRLIDVAKDVISVSEILM